MSCKTKRQNRAYKHISAERRGRWEKFLGCVGTCEKGVPVVLCELGCYQKHLKR
jgi:hypothetical protein